jgi:Bacterial Ig domain
VVPGNKSMNANSTIGPFAVTIGDLETPAGTLVLTASSSVPSVIANSDITLGGSGANRTVSIHVPAGRIGTSVITLTVSDGAQTAKGSFIVNVNYVNTAPTISLIPNQVTDEDTPLTVQFTIGDSNNLPSHLSVGTSTSNDQLFPAGSIRAPAASLGGVGSRSFVFTPAPDRSGTATVSVSVSDGFLATTQTFTLTVRPVEDPPAFVRITSPRTGDRLLPGVPALITAEAFDAETNLARLQFYGRTPSNAIDQLIGLTTNAPYFATWSNPPAGDFTLYAIAFDQTSLGATSPPVAISVSAPMVSPPKLYIARLTNSVAVLWLDSVSSNALQTATNLARPGPWSPASSSPQLGEGAWFYLVPPSDKSRFFRLAQ